MSKKFKIKSVRSSVVADEMKSNKGYGYGIEGMGMMQHDHALELIRPGTLVVPQKEPTNMREGEVALYISDSGVGGETPAGGSGVSSYVDLTNKPKINGIELKSGNNTLAELGIASLNHTHTIAQITSLQTTLDSKVKQVKIGTTAYNPASGIVTLPAYPTTLPASDVPAWAKQPNKPAYTTAEVTESTNLYFTEARAKAVKVNNALNADKLGGQLPAYYAKASDLNKYLPLAGGEMTGTITGLVSSNFRGIRYKNDTEIGGWARPIASVYNIENTKLGEIGAYGTEQNLGWFYIGTSYSSEAAWLKVGTDILRYKNYNIYHAGNSNLLSVAWKAKYLNLPVLSSAPTISEGVAFYYSNVGQGSETPTGGGGVSSYVDLADKPKINGIELKSGNNTLAELGIASLNHTHTIAQITSLQTTLDSKVKRIIVGETAYNPANGVITLPAYLTSYVDLTNKPKINGIELKSGNNTLAELGIASLNHTHTIAQITSLQTTLDSKVKQVKIGTTAYNPASGIVTLPAYPTTLPASDVPAWAKQPNKPAYTTAEVTESTNLYFTEARAKAVKVNNALNADKLGGQLPAYYAKASDLNKYLPLAGGEMTGTITGLVSSNFRGIRYKNDTEIGGWARPIASVYNIENTKLGEIGAYGTEQNLGWFYIGTSYSSEAAWLKVGTDILRYKNYNIYHAGNSNLLSVAWKAKYLNLPVLSSAPTISEGVAFYYSNVGQGSETPTGGGGVSSYVDLADKPKINGIELKSGNNTLAELGIASLNHTHTIAQITSLQTTLDSKVKRIIVGETAYNPANGVITLPAYLTSYVDLTNKPKINGIELKSGNNTLAELGIASLNHTHTIAQITSLQTTLDSKVKQVKIGTTAYNPASGIVTLPAYPTTLPASDVPAWAKQPNKPAYTTAEVTESTNLYFTEARAKAVKVNNALNADKLGGQLPAYYAKASDLNKYLPLAGGEMTGTITGLVSSKFRGIRYKNDTEIGGWARPIASVYNIENTKLGEIGAYGTEQNLGWFYIGTSYSSEAAWLKVGTDILRYKNYNIYHAGNSNLLSVAWKAKYLNLPVLSSAPAVSEGVALYISDSSVGGEIPALPAEWLNNYYTKLEIDNTILPIEQQVTSNTNKIATLEAKVRALENQ